MIHSKIPGIQSILINLLRVLRQFGLDISQENISNYASELIQLKKKNAFEQVLVYEMHKAFFEALIKFETFKDSFVRHLETTLEPSNYGILRSWRPTQKEAIRTLMSVFDQVFVRPVSEIPTGAGKSMLWGAIARAFYEALKECNMDQEIVIVTSRINISNQLISSVDNKENEEDSPLDMGEVKLWFQDIPNDKIRLLIGKKSNLNSEVNKENPILTIVAYQGLTPSRIEKLFLGLKPMLIILDESHNTTERVAMNLNQLNAWCVGGSATVVGAHMRTPFHFFDPIAKTEEEILSVENIIQLFAFFKGIVELIRDGELKPVRWIDVKTKIDLSNAQTLSNPYSYRTIFNESSVSEILMKNADAGFQVLKEIYLNENLMLTLSGSKQVIDRIGLVFVHRIDLAKYYVQKCTDELLPLLKERYGEDVVFHASYVDGFMDEDMINTKMKLLREGKITLMFTVEKLGEGADAPGINMIIPLRALGFGSQWKLKQWIGRGIRLDENDENADLLVVDGVFESKCHNLASVFGILNQTSSFSGGLIAGRKGQLDLENKVFKLLSYGFSPLQISQELTLAEQLCAQQMKLFSLVGESYQEHQKDYSEVRYKIAKIHFIEREDIRLSLTLSDYRRTVHLIGDVLKKNGYNRKRLESVKSLLLISFCKQSFQNVGRGIDLINLVNKTNHKKIGPHHFQQFLDTLFRHGWSDNVNDTTDSSCNKLDIFDSLVKTNYIGFLYNFCRTKFGVEPIVTCVSRKTFEGKEYFTSQATLSLDDYQCQSGFCYAFDKSSSKRLASKELTTLLEEAVENHSVKVFLNSEMFYLNIRCLKKICYESSTTLTYLEKETDKGFECQASARIHKKVISGLSVLHESKENARLLAEASLFDHFADKVNPETFILVTNSTYEDKLRKLCADNGINEIHIKSKTYGYAPTELYSCLIKVQFRGQLVNSSRYFEIFLENAKEKAAQDLFKKLQTAFLRNLNPQSNASPFKGISNLHPVEQLDKLKRKYKFQVVFNEERLTREWEVQLHVLIDGQQLESASHVYNSKQVAMEKAVNEILPRIKECILKNQNNN